MNLGYTKKEKEYSKKSWTANLLGGSLIGFGQVGGLKFIKAGKGLKLGMAKGGQAVAMAGQLVSASSLYFDAQAIKNSKVKTRATINAIGRNLFGGFAGSLAGGGAAAGLRFGILPKAKSFVKTKMASDTARFYKATPANKAAGLGQMIKDKAIRFVRIRGRIVPIRGKSTRVGPALLAAPKGK